MTDLSNPSVGVMLALAEQEIDGKIERIIDLTKTMLLELGATDQELAAEIKRQRAELKAYRAAAFAQLAAFFDQPPTRH